ncbi:MAG: hypothetical protein H6644_10880 [Caldilineaceae bacterium]|nr:hypothetical protein [Caldilineaceae bacterium]
MSHALKTSRHRLRWTALLLILSLALSACAAPAAPADSGDAAAPDAAAPAEAAATTGGTLVIARPTDAVGLDPKVETTSPGNWVMSNIYENLVKLDTDLTFQPALAESWEQVEPDRWRFNLRQGVKFHDGTDFNADAVKFSIERIKNPDDPGRSASNLRPIIAVEVVDDYTVDIVTDGAYGPLLNIMSLVYATGIVSPAAVEQYGEDFTRNPVGTGPFKFVEWRTNDQIVIERNEDYWGEPAPLDQVVYRVIPEESARMLALDTGEVQMVMAPAPSQLDIYRDDPNFTLYETPGVRVIFFGMMTARASDDVCVRQALVYSFDKQAVLDNIVEERRLLPDRLHLAARLRLDRHQRVLPLRSRACGQSAGRGRLGGQRRRRHPRQGRRKAEPAPLQRARPLPEGRGIGRSIPGRHARTGRGSPVGDHGMGHALRAVAPAGHARRSLHAGLVDCHRRRRLHAGAALRLQQPPAGRLELLRVPEQRL